MTGGVNNNNFSNQLHTYNEFFFQNDNSVGTNRAETRNDDDSLYILEANTSPKITDVPIDVRNNDNSRETRGNNDVQTKSDVTATNITTARSKSYCLIPSFRFEKVEFFFPNIGYFKICMRPNYPIVMNTLNNFIDLNIYYVTTTWQSDLENRKRTRTGNLTSEEAVILYVMSSSSQPIDKLRIFNERYGDVFSADFLLNKIFYKVQKDSKRELDFLKVCVYSNFFHNLIEFFDYYKLKGSFIYQEKIKKTFEGLYYHEQTSLSNSTYIKTGRDTLEGVKEKFDSALRYLVESLCTVAPEPARISNNPNFLLSHIDLSPQTQVVPEDPLKQTLEDVLLKPFSGEKNQTTIDQLVDTLFSDFPEQVSDKTLFDDANNFLGYEDDQIILFEEAFNAPRDRLDESRLFDQASEKSLLDKREATVTEDAIINTVPTFNVNENSLINPYDVSNLKIYKRLLNVIIDAIENEKRSFLNLAKFNNDVAKLIFNIKDFEKRIKKKVNKRNKKEVACYNVLCRHFGIDIENLDQVSNKDQYFCLITFLKYLLPAVYEYKKSQAFAFLESMQYSPNEEPTLCADMDHIQILPSLLIATKNDKAILLPTKLKVAGVNESYGYKEHVLGFQNDDDNSCLGFLNEIDSHIEQEKNGSILLSLEQLHKLEAKLYKYVQAGQMPIRILPYAGKVELMYETSLDNMSVDIPEIEEAEKIYASVPDAMQIEHGPNQNKSAKKKKIKNNETLEPPKKVIKYSNNEAHYLTSRKETYQGQGFNLDEISNKSASKNTKNEGTLLPGMNEGGIIPNNLMSHYNGFWAKALKPIQDVKHNIQKVSAHAEAQVLNSLKYPISKWIQNKYGDIAVQPLIRSLKPYQVDALQRYKKMEQMGISPLCCLEMGLGKTYIYVNLIAENIAKIDRGISMVLVPAATRLKTVEEIKWGLIEAKYTALLLLEKRFANDPGEFFKFWQAAVVKNCVDQKGNKCEELKPLMMAADRSAISDELSKKGAKFKMSFYNTIYQNSIDIIHGHLETLKGYEELQDAALKNGCKRTKNGGLYYEPNGDLIKLLRDAAAITNLSPHPRNDIADSADGLSIDECRRLIEYPLSNVILMTFKNAREKAEVWEAVVRDSDKVIISGYETISELEKTLQEKLFSASHRILICDEAQKYHTKKKEKKQGAGGNSINEAINRYARSLRKNNIPVAGVTGTPFENNISELIELLNVSNVKFDRDSNQWIEPFPSESIATLKMQFSAASNAIADWYTTNFTKSPKDALIKSFAHHMQLRSLLNQVVITKRMKDRDVKDAWEEKVPNKLKQSVLLDIPEENKELSNKVAQVLSNFFSGRGSLSEVSLLSMGSKLAMHYIDIKSVEKSILLKTMKDTVQKIDRLIRSQPKSMNESRPSLNGSEKMPLTTSSRALLPELEASLKNKSDKIKDAAPFGDHQFVRDLIENPKINEFISKSEKLIIVYQYDVEAAILSPILEHLYNKNVYLFGENDAKREEAIGNLKRNSNSVLLLPMKAGGVGLNLGFTDNMLILGKTWNPALFKQVMARVVRVGRGGEREILIVSRNNLHEQFVSCVFRRKTQFSKFLFSHETDSKKLLSYYVESVLNQVLKRFMLSSKDSPGIFRGIPILSAQKQQGVRSRVQDENNNNLSDNQFDDQVSIESLLRMNLKKLLENEVSENDLQKLIRQTS